MLFFDTSLESPEKNMRYDDELLKLTLADQQIRLRVYLWQTKGITYPKSVGYMLDYASIAQAERSTGGGIVFHSSGDVVWSLCILASDPRLPFKTKEKLYWISQWLLKSISHYCPIVEVEGEALREVVDLKYCATYPNPYELIVADKKVAGIAVRRYREVIMAQGVIHMEGLSDYVEGEVLQRQLFRLFERSLLDTIGQ